MATDVQAPLPSLGDYQRLLLAAESMLRFFEMRTVHPFFNKYDAITEMLAWEKLQQIQAQCFSSYSGTLESEHHQAQWWACNAFQAIAEPIQSCSIGGVAFVPSPDELGRIRISISGFRAAIESLSEAAQAPLSDPPDGTAVLQPPREMPPVAAAIDSQDIADTLLRANHVLPAKLVMFMADRRTASFQEVMDEVHGGDRADETVRVLVNRTNNLLRLSSRLRFTTLDSHVIRQTAIE